jgi:hypothetical protein
MDPSRARAIAAAMVLGVDIKMTDAVRSIASQAQSQGGTYPALDRK